MCVKPSVNLMPRCLKHSKVLLKTHSKVPRLNEFRSMMLLSKTIHEMWRDHTYSAKETRQQKECWRGGGGEFEKGGKQYMGVFI